MKNILITILLLAFMIIFGETLVYAIAKQSVIECRQWQKQALIFSKFYLTKDQDAQCKAYGILVDTTVKN